MDIEQQMQQMIDIMKDMKHNAKDCASAGALRDLVFPTPATIPGFTVIDQLQEELWCVHYRVIDAYYCAEIPSEPNIKCLIVTAKRNMAESCIEVIDGQDSQDDPIPTAVTLEEAKDLAREKDLDALLFLDDSGHMNKIYFVQ